MHHLPKTVRDKLASQGMAGSHPDADLLNLLREGELAGRERETVLAHLATCASCREIAALSAVPHPELAVAVEPRRRWFTWPMLRWVAAASAVVVVGTAILMRESEQRQAGWDGEDLIYERPAATSAEQEQKAVAGPPQKTLPTANAVSAKRQPSATETTKSEKQKRSEAAPGIVKELAPQEKAPGPAAAPPPAAPKIQITTQEQAPVALQALPRQLSAESKADRFAERQTPGPPGSDAQYGYSRQQSQVPQQQLAKAQSSPIPQRQAAVAAAPLGSRAADERTALPRQEAGAAMPTRPRTMMTAARPTASWSITEAGAPERSTDQGQSWQIKSPDASAFFRTVVSAGTSVWAGGRNGVLYRSSDAGEHWQRVPSPTGSDIVHLDWNAGGEIVLADATGAQWKSTDNGATWIGASD